MHLIGHETNDGTAVTVRATGGAAAVLATLLRRERKNSVNDGYAKMLLDWEEKFALVMRESLDGAPAPEAEGR